MATDVLEPGLSAPPRGDRDRSPVEWAARAVVVAAALFPLCVYLWVALHQLGYPFELEWLEGGSVEIVNRVVHGQGLYVAPTLHYTPYPYTPLYFWVSGLLAHVTGVSFLPLRLVSFVASLGCFGLLFSMVRRETGDAVAGVLAAGLFAASWEVGGSWLDIGRVDSLFMVLLLGAVAVARVAATWRGGLAVGLLVFASFFTKQTALLAAAPLLVLLVVTRRRVGLAALATVVVTVVGSTVLMDLLTHGWYQYYVVHELLHQGVNGVSWHRFIPDDLLRPTGWMVLLGGLGAVLGLWRRRAGGTDWPFWLAVAAGFLGAAWISRLHAGGGRDVLQPAYLALSLLGALGYDALRRAAAGSRSLVRSVVAAALAGVVVLQVVHLFHHPSHLIPTAGDQAVGRRFVATLAATPGQVLVLDHPWYATMAGKGTWAQGEAVHDVLRAGPSQARTDLEASIRATLADPALRTVYLDDRGDEGILGPGLTSRFTHAPGQVFDCYQCFFPPTDVALRPALKLVRTPSAPAS